MALQAPTPDPSAHFLPPGEVFRALGTRAGGLTGEEAAERLARSGPNAIRRVRSGSFAQRFFSNFTHLMSLLLWAGGLAAFAARMPQLGVAIWLVNVINGVFSFWQEFRARKAVDALQRVLPREARVLRAGREARIPAEELVRGDVLVLAEGDRISADARLVEEAELRVDQSTLTGESHPAKKSAFPTPGEGPPRAQTPWLVFAGTAVVSGTGKAVVYATGMGTELGRIAHLTQAVREEQSPLQRELSHVTRTVTAIAVGVGTLFGALAVALVGIDMADGFLFALGMVVAFVPEGLLPTVTLALALGVQRMARKNALVKKLSAVETLGCASVICTDKTGTLTQNEMTVRELWLPAGRFEVRGTGYEPEGEIVKEGETAPTASGGDLRNLLIAAALCSNARVLPPDERSPRWSVLGDPTEGALLVAAAKAGLDLDEEARRKPRVREIPFDSRRKRMATVHRTASPEGLLMVFVKGAPREVLARCTLVRREGRDEPLEPPARAAIEKANDRCARSGLRVLAVSERTLAEPSLDPESVETELTFLGLVALMDPPRPEVAEAVRKCHRAGIRVTMITGDYGLTAESVARRIGVVKGRQVRIVSGPEMESMDGQALREALAGEVIFARAAPEHKLRVVEALQGLGHVVAVTGDGVNDAPALQKADIGVAMGLAGTDVAREAADVILADDNFASIVSAVEEGRAVYANIRKFITYILTSNVPEAVPFVLFALSRGRVPLALTVMQILAIDLGTDLMPALALGAEPPEPGVMERPPRDLGQHAIDRPLLFRAYLQLGLTQSAAALAAFYFVYWSNGYAGQWLDLPTVGPLYHLATAMTLATVVTTQVGNLFAQRSERASLFSLGLLGNRLLWLGIAAELAVLAVVVYWPPTQRLFGTSPIPLGYWPFVFAWTPALPLIDEACKALRRRGARRSSGGAT